jgi:hypothetical protein
MFTRLAFQQLLIQTGQARQTSVMVTVDGVIYDGHHAVRAIAEMGGTVDVLVVSQTIQPSGFDILALPVR